jgi:hypothetical protein
VVNFNDRSGFQATLDVGDLRNLAERLALFLLERDQAADNA